MKLQKSWDSNKRQLFFWLRKSNKNHILVWGKSSEETSMKKQFFQQAYKFCGLESFFQKRFLFIHKGNQEKIKDINGFTGISTIPTSPTTTSLFISNLLKERTVVILKFSKNFEDTGLHFAVSPLNLIWWNLYVPNQLWTQLCN